MKELFITEANKQISGRIKCSLVPRPYSRVLCIASFYIADGIQSVVIVGNEVFYVLMGKVAQSSWNKASRPWKLFGCLVSCVFEFSMRLQNLRFLLQPPLNDRLRLRFRIIVMLESPGEPHVQLPGHSLICDKMLHSSCHSFRQFPVPLQVIHLQNRTDLFCTVGMVDFSFVGLVLSNTIIAFMFVIITRVVRTKTVELSSDSNFRKKLICCEPELFWVC